MKKIFSLAIFATLYSVCIAQTNSSKYLYLTKSFNDAGFNKINVETSHGNIAVTNVPSTETRVEVYVRSSNSNEELSKEEIQKKLDEYYKLDISLEANVLNAVVHQKKDFWDGKSSLSISFRIYASKGKSTELKTSHGDIELSGMEGIQDLETSHGNISAENITGKLTAETSHGDVHVAELKDDIDIRTDHGNIDAKNCEGSVKLITSNGDVVLDHVKGKVHTGTDHGNITGNSIEGTLSASTSHGDLTFKELSCSVDASTDHGNIKLIVEKISGDITTGNSHGDISVQLPKGNGIDLDLRGRGVDMVALENFNGTRKKDEIKGTMNGGGTKVSATTDKGQISLTFR